VCVEHGLDAADSVLCGLSMSLTNFGVAATRVILSLSAISGLIAWYSARLASAVRCGGLVVADVGAGADRPASSDTPAMAKYSSA
jgi:hypothetical protein